MQLQYYCQRMERWISAFSEAESAGFGLYFIPEQQYLHVLQKLHVPDGFPLAVTWQSPWSRPGALFCRECLIQKLQIGGTLLKMSPDWSPLLQVFEFVLFVEKRKG